jgi:hypothetical protein
MARIRSILFTLVLLGGGAFAATPAQAASQRVTCAQLQAALDGAGNGDVITLEAGEVCHQGYTLKSHVAITLDGEAGATLDGDTGDGRTQILTGFCVGGTTIQNLTFTHGVGDDENGGAIDLRGDGPITIAADHFFNNEAQYESGGAVSIRDANCSPPPGLTARLSDTPQIVVRDSTFGTGSSDGNAASVDGGALYVNTTDPVSLERNSFAGNAAEQEGGGAWVNTCGTIDVNGNTFTGNRLQDDPVSSDEGNSGDDRYGAGLELQNGCSQVFGLGLGSARARADDDPQLLQSGNRFADNVIEDTSGEQAGAGEDIDELDGRSTDDQYVRNVIANTAETHPPGKSESSAEGAGVSIFTAFQTGTYEARNLAVAGNKIDGDGDGGGMYFGEQSTLRLLDSTVAGNQAPRASGLTGDGDHLELRNTIVAVNTGADQQIDGFASTDAKASLLCTADAPADGSVNAAGDFCANPMLADPVTGDVHETTNSPSRNTGDDTLVPADLGQDYEGADARILESHVDIGADEFAPVPVTQTPPPATTTAPPPKPAQAVSPIKVRACVSRRGFKIRLRVPRGHQASSASVRVVGTKVRITIQRRRLTAPVILRNLPKGTFKVNITIHLKGGRKVTGTRVYHTCAKKRTGTIPKV